LLAIVHHVGRMAPPSGLLLRNMAEVLLLLPEVHECVHVGGSRCEAVAPRLKVDTFCRPALLARPWPCVPAWGRCAFRMRSSLCVRAACLCVQLVCACSLCVRAACLCVQLVCACSLFVRAACLCVLRSTRTRLGRGVARGLCMVCVHGLCMALADCTSFPLLIHPAGVHHGVVAVFKVALSAEAVAISEFEWSLRTRTSPRGVCPTVSRSRESV
jgi:hypothetical protein